MSALTDQPALAGMASWQPGSVVLNEFMFERVLGEGGFGTVALLRSLRSSEGYAVKRTKINDPVRRAQFLNELRNWINLPAHPHIVACRFFRTVGEEIAIFAEYVPGGSLHDWLVTGRLYEGGEEPALARVLDIAIQAAWGLHAAHQRGLVHQDVKPGNIMLTNDSMAKVADFGLAAGQHQVSSASLKEVAFKEMVKRWVIDPMFQDIQDDGTGQLDLIKAEFLRGLLNDGNEETLHTAVFPGGKPCTLAYASPEQVTGRELNRRTDTWSWGVTVLEMFAGQRNWVSGSVAHAVLKDLLGGASAVQLVLPLSGDVAKVLRRCFCHETSKRWPSMNEAAVALQHVYRTVTGHDYLRRRPPESSQPDTEAVGDARMDAVTGAAWSDPRGWLQLAYQATGTDPATLGELWPLSMGNRRARAVTDLAAMEEARGRLEAVVAGNPERTLQLGILCGEIAKILFTQGDTQGAIQAQERGIAVLGGYEATDAVRHLANALNWLAVYLRNAGRKADSIDAIDRCIGLCQEPAKSGDADSRIMLAYALMNRGSTLADGGTLADDCPSALEHFELAIQNLEGLDEPEALAKLLASKATLQQAIGNTEMGRVTWDSADAMLSRLIKEGRTDLRIILAYTWVNRSKQASDLSEKLMYARKAIDVLTSLVVEEGRSEFAGDLGRAYFQAGMSLEALSRTREALDAYSQSCQWYSVAVREEGQFKFVGELARALDYESTLARLRRDPEVAINLSRRAVELWENLIQAEGTDVQELQLALAQALSNLGTSLSKAEQTDEAAAILERSIQLHREYQGRISAETQASYAAAIHARAVVFHRVKDLASAIQGHSDALGLVRSLDDFHARGMAAMVSRDLSNARRDAGDYGLSLTSLDEAITRYEALVEAGEARHRERLAEALQDRVHWLREVGMFEEACATANRALPMYECLVLDEGRDDLTFDMGRLLLGIGYAYRNLFRPDEAVPYFERSVSLFELARRSGRRRFGRWTAQQFTERCESITNTARELGELIIVKPADFDRWIVTAREKTQLAERHRQIGNTIPAQQTLHEAVSIVIHLGRVSGESRFLELTVRWSINEGDIAFLARLPPASESAFRLALSLVDRLLATQPRPDLIEAMARAYLGLASILHMEGHEDSRTLVREMEARLEALDPRQRVRWSKEADRRLSEKADRRFTEFRKWRDRDGIPLRMAPS